MVGSYIRCLILGLAGTTLMMAGATRASAQSPVRVVARTDDPAAGTPAGTTFSTFSTAVINSLGTTAFVGTVKGAGITADNDSGLWSATPGALSLVARENALAPGTVGDVRFAQFQFPSLNNLGQVELFAQLRGSGVNAATAYGTWAGLPGTIQLGHRSGNPLPGINPAFDASIGAFPVYSNTGSIAFTGIYDDPNLPGSEFGIWAGPPGAIAAVAIPGQHAPGFAAGVTFRNALVPTISSGGQIAYQASIQGTGVTLSNDSGIWLHSGGTSSLVVREGNAAPGPGSLNSFGGTFGEPAINASGAIAFTNTLTGPFVTSDNEHALCAGLPGNLSLVAREGGTATGASPGVVFDDFHSRPLIGGSGAVVDAVKLRGNGVTMDNDDGIWANPTGVFSKVAREGDPAPETAAQFKTLGSPTTNYYGQTAFHAFVNDASTSSGIWAVDPFNRLVLVAGQGQSLRLGQGDERTVLGTSLLVGSGGQDGRSSSFNAASQLAFSVSFEDGTSAAVVARVGGTARVSDIAPVLGSAAVNGYGLGSPATAGDVVSVLGDSGFIRFAEVAPAGGLAQILLDFNGTDSGVAAALAEIAAGADLYGYAFTQLGGGDFQAMLEVLSMETTPQFFYWNILNIGNVDLQRVQFVPEPSTAALIGLATMVFAGRRRRRV